MTRVFNKEIIYGLYNDEEELLHAIREAKKAHLEIDDVYTPFPVHGLDPLLGLSESRLHQGGFVYGMLGTMTGFGFMTWAFTRDWPIIFGGKPHWPVPSFIPVTFELTVLFASIGMVVTFYTICGMGPGIKNPVIDERITDDKFCLSFSTKGVGSDVVEKFKNFFAQTGAAEVNSKSI